MPKVTMIGAGSAVFARQVITDTLAIEGLDDGIFALVDIDAERLELARQIAERLVDLSGKRWTVQVSTDRGEVLHDSDYIVNSIEVAGLQNVRADYDIPLRYGVDQCIGDTIGPGGIFKALRTGPAWLDIVADVTRIAPEATVLNYTNPMSILTLAAARSTSLPVVGLCHSVQGTSRLLADFLEVPYEELDWKCAGINHNAWFTKLEHNGEDLYPKLRRRAADPEIYEQDPVRFEVMLRLGAFVTDMSQSTSRISGSDRTSSRSTRGPGTWARAASTPTTGRDGGARTTNAFTRCCGARPRYRKPRGTNTPHGSSRRWSSAARRASTET